MKNKLIKGLISVIIILVLIIIFYFSKPQIDNYILNKQNQAINESFISLVYLIRTNGYVSFNLNNQTIYLTEIRPNQNGS